MQNKQTAVEWLVQYVNSEEYQKAFGQTYISVVIIEQAKQIEKEQIMQSYNDGKSAVIYIEENKSLEQYYNETYNNEK